MNLSSCRKLNDRHSDRGFTLVEVIVVLAVIAIISSAAVLSITGYIDKARFDKNEQNAQSVFQATQAAISRKKTAGEIESWVTDVLMQDGKADPYYPTNSDRNEEGAELDKLFNPVDFSNFNGASNNPGESVHMRYVLTYRKGGTDAESMDVQDLLSAYFYDTTVMQATFSIEFDVEKTIDSEGEPHYYANAYAVFYDEGRSDWDAKAMNNLDCKVPLRDSHYRRSTSLVGYYNGGVPGAVDSIYVPNMDEKMEFAELTLRNGEALELSFSALMNNTPVTGSGLYNVHYTASIYDIATDEKLADLVINEAALTNGTPTKNSPTDYNSALKFEAGTKNDGDTDVRNIGGSERQVLYTVENLNDKNGNPITRYAATIDSFALVYLHQGSGDFDYNSLAYGDLSGVTDFYRFPIKISYVINKDKSGNETSYVAYSIALDSMMSRDALYKAETDTSGTKTKALNYSISRLFADTAGFNKTLAPKNIYVSMTAAADAFTDPNLADCNVTNDIPASDATKATRALDDPVFLQADGTYKVSEHAAGRDSSDGFAVVNTYYGDISIGSMGSNETEGTATITSFRHLYNIRFMEGFTGDVEYSIRRDLNWYKYADGKYTSDVRVYDIVSGKTYLDYNSPVGKNAKTVTDAKLVMWPALSKLSAKQKIVAAENALSSVSDDKTSVIRNVQMRKKSFLSSDKGLGFICENDGTITNLRCENFMLTLDETVDGAANDTDNADKAVSNLIANGTVNRSNTTKALDGKNIGKVPVGGLVGLNKGLIGDASAPSDLGSNTVRMSNVSVITGTWNGSKCTLYSDLTSIGGAVGEYGSSASSNGLISTEGYSAVAGCNKVAGIIGAAYAGIDAYLNVDTTKGTDTATVDFQSVDAFIMGRSIVGGAVAYMKDGYFAQDVTAPAYNCSANGVVSFEEKASDRYGVTVNLSEGSYIRQAGKPSEGTGGAVGQIENYTAGKKMSIKTINDGYILNDGDATSKYVSGSVGYLHGGSASLIHIHAENSGGIGTKDGTSIYDDKNVYDHKCYAAAAGIAYITNFGNNDTKYVFNVNNSGLLYGGTNQATLNAGVGIAVGALDTNTSPAFMVRAINSGTIVGDDFTGNQTQDTFWKTGGTSEFGVGGAIGFARSLGSSHIYVEHASGSSIEARGNNLGGAVGCIKNVAKGNSDADAFTVTSALQAGTSVRGDGINVGGCIGNIWNQGDYCILRTRVEGNVTIKAFKNVGGVVGRGQQAASAEGAYAYLQGASSAPKLSIIAIRNNGTYENNNTINAGGVIGVAGGRGIYTTSVIGPAQSETDKLVMDVKAQSNVGGLVGTLYLSELEGATPQHFDCKTPEFSITLNPASTVAAASNGNYAGGAIGVICDNRNSFANGNAADFISNVSVTIPAGRTDTAAMISGQNHLGGAVGAVFVKGLGGSISTKIDSPNAITGNNWIGGAIGTLSLTGAGTDGTVKAVINAADIVRSANESGGCIGQLVGPAAGGTAATLKTVETVIGNEGKIGAFSPITGNNNMGGSIGLLKGNAQVGSVYTTVNTTGNLITATRNDAKYVGGVVGRITEGGVIADAQLKGKSLSANLITTAGYVGGIAGAVEAGCMVSDMFGEVPVNVAGNYDISGYVGYLNGGILGTPGKTLEINNIKTVKATNVGDKEKYGTGSLIGVMDNSGVVQWDKVSVTLNEGCFVEGGFNTGGMIGQIQSGSVTGNLDTHFAGGRVQTKKGGMGGVIGGMFGGEATGWLSTYIESKYSTTDATQSALAGLTEGSECKGVGGVIGQMGDQKTPEGKVVNIHVNTMVLRFEEDFALLSGTSSVGGVLGQCETINGRIDNITVKSMDEQTTYKFVIKPAVKGAYDVGGLIGYMLSPLPDDLKALNIDITVEADHYVGGWIGGFDGKLNGTYDVQGVKSVNGKYGIGGVMGGFGVFNDGGQINGKLNVDLDGVTIHATSDGGVGGVIGIMGDPANDSSSDIKSEIKGEINVTLSNTEISGTANAGGVIGLNKNRGRVLEGCRINTNVTDSSSAVISSSRNAGGIVGGNDGVFLADVDLNVSEGKEYKISAQKGYVGTMIGRNGGTFGRLNKDTIVIPKGKGKVNLDATTNGFTGAIVGENTGLCGLVNGSGGSYSEADSGELKYRSDVELTGKYDKTADRVGFVGSNRGRINRVVMNDDVSSTDSDDPDNSSGDASNDASDNALDNASNDASVNALDSVSVSDFSALSSNESVVSTNGQADPDTSGDSGSDTGSDPYGGNNDAIPLSGNNGSENDHDNNDEGNS